MVPNNNENKYDVDGFCRRTPATEPAPAPPPPHVESDVIEISSEDEADFEDSVDSTETWNLNDLPIHELEIKREKMEAKIRDLEKNLNETNKNENQTDETGEFELNEVNNQSEPMCQNVQNIKKTPVQGMNGYQTPESLGQSSNISSGIGSIVNYDLSEEENDDDFLLDLPKTHQGGSNTNRQMNNVSTQKVQFTMKLEKLNQNNSLQSLPENVNQIDDTTQMMPDTVNDNYNSMYSNQNEEQFQMENSGYDRFAPNSDVHAPQKTPTLFSTHVKPPVNYNLNGNMKMKPNQNYSDNIDMNNDNSNQYRSPMNNNFFYGNAGATPIYPPFEQQINVKELLKDELSQMKDELFKQNRKEIIEELYKDIENSGLVLVRKDDYTKLLKEQKESDRSSKHTSKNGERGSSKRHFSSPNRHFDGHHEYQRSAGSSKKVKSSCKTSTVTSANYQQLQNDSNPVSMDYEMASSSSESNEIFKPSFTKETTTPLASSSGKCFKLFIWFLMNFG